MSTTKKVVAASIKSGKGSSQYWLTLENHQEIPCLEREYVAAKTALNTGGFHVVSVKFS